MRPVTSICLLLVVLAVLGGGAWLVTVGAQEEAREAAEHVASAVHAPQRAAGAVGLGTRAGGPDGTSSDASSGVAPAAAPAPDAGRIEQDRQVWRLRGMIERGDLDGLRRAVEGGIDPDVGSTARGGGGPTLLRWSLGLRRLDVTELLLSLGAHPRAAFAEDTFFLPPDPALDLEWFVEFRVLGLTRGVSGEPPGYAAAMAAIGRRLGPDTLAARPDLDLALATAAGDMTRVQALVSRGVRPDRMFGATRSTGSTETSALLIATDLRMHRMIDLFIDAVGGTAGLRDHRTDRYTPLARAAASGDVARIRDLLREGAAVDGEGYAPTAGEHRSATMTPLYYAARNGQLDAVRALADAGADVRATGYAGETVLGGAIVGGDARVVRELIDRGAPVRTSRFDALHACVTWDRPELVAFFYPGPPARATAATGAEVRDAVADPLAHAAQWGRTAVVRALLDRGMGPDGAVPDLGTRPIELAAMGGRLEILRMLLDAGADATPLWRTGPDGLDAVARASRRGWTDIEELLTATRAKSVR